MDSDQKYYVVEKSFGNMLFIVISTIVILMSLIILFQIYNKFDAADKRIEFGEKRDYLWEFEIGKLKERMAKNEAGDMVGNEKIASLEDIVFNNQLYPRVKKEATYGM